MGLPSDQFLRLLYGPRMTIGLVYLLTIWAGSPHISFCAYFLGAPLRSVFSLTIRGHFRSVSSHTIWGVPQISFFAYYMGVRWDQFLRLLYGMVSFYLTYNWSICNTIIWSKEIRYKLYVRRLHKEYTRSPLLCSHQCLDCNILYR